MSALAPQMTIAERVTAWQEVSVVLNELSRSIGRADAYPFAIAPRVIDKLEFVHRVIGDLRGQP